MRYLNSKVTTRLFLWCLESQAKNTIVSAHHSCHSLAAGVTQIQKAALPHLQSSPLLGISPSLNAAKLSKELVSFLNEAHCTFVHLSGSLETSARNSGKSHLTKGNTGLTLSGITMQSNAKRCLYFWNLIHANLRI